MLSRLPHNILSQLSRNFARPEQILAELDIREGDTILEIGMPVGYFHRAACKLIGPKGTLYIAGPNSESLEHVRSVHEHTHIKPVLLSDVLLGKSIEVGSVDLVLLTNLLSNSFHPDAFCLSIGQFLKPQSEVVLIDWDTQQEKVGPLHERRMSKEQAIQLLAQCGLKFKRVLHITGYHYGLVFSSSLD